MRHSQIIEGDPAFCISYFNFHYPQKDITFAYNICEQLMGLKLNNWVKALLVFICLILSILGFMVKLPSGFRHFDKELHATYYFIAAGFLNILFTNGKFTRHILIFVVLYFFSISIEHAQEYSNKFFRVRIHGRYDPEDVKYNLRGLIVFSALWITYKLAMTVYNRITFKPAINNPDLIKKD
jgi:hypothetical protein